MTTDRVGDDELRAQGAELLPDREALTLLDPSGGTFGGIEPGLGLVDVGADGSGSTDPTATDPTTTDPTTADPTTTDPGGDLLGVGADAGDHADDVDTVDGTAADRDETFDSSDSASSAT